MKIEKGKQPALVRTRRTGLARLTMVFLGLATLLLGVFVLWYCAGKWQIPRTREMVEVMLITSTLECYSRLNQGSLPNSWDDLININLAERSEEFSHGMKVRSSLEGNKASQLFLIQDIRRYRIAFGLGPEDIIMQKSDGPDFDILGPDGKPILLIAPTEGSSLIDLVHYRSCTRGIASVMKRYGKERND